MAGAGGGAVGERRVSASFPGDARSVRAARQLVRETLGRWDGDAYEWALAQLVSELATNAVIHAGTEFELALDLTDDRLRCEVTDGAAGASPRLRRYAADATTGRGLALVKRLSARWGVEPHADGKTVWFELDAGVGTAALPLADLEDLAGRGGGVDGVAPRGEADSGGRAPRLRAGRRAVA